MLHKMTGKMRPLAYDIANKQKNEEFILHKWIQFDNSKIVVVVRVYSEIQYIKQYLLCQTISFSWAVFCVLKVVRRSRSSH